jgi:two-component system chemotaxis response regulator CheY
MLVLRGDPTIYQAGQLYEAALALLEHGADVVVSCREVITLIRQLRSNPLYKFIPILMLTTESQDSKKQEGKAAGATGWLIKPFNPQQLLGVIAKVVR